MISADFNEFLADLSAKSEDEFIDPRSVEWPAEADPDAWYFTPELISLYGTDAWASLDERDRKRLSLAEAVNFFSLNVHGEKFLISEISRRLYATEQPELSRYLTHFIEEETRHMMYFAGFCRRYAGKLYPDRTVQFGTVGDERFETLLLFARINVFEEIVDHYNRIMAKDERLAPIAREINRIHHVEEMRHLSFGRRFLGRCLERHAGHRDVAGREAVRAHLSGYLQFVWKQYYNPEAYEDAGIASAFEVWRETVDSPAARAHRASVNRYRLSYLGKLGLLEAA